MKKVLIAALLLVACWMPVRAASTSTHPTDNFFGKVWTDVATNSSFHFLDNLTPATFYDFKQHTLMAGGTTAVYKYRSLSVDGGVVRSIDDQAKDNGNAIPILGLNFHGGAFIDSYRAAHNLGSSVGFDQGLLKYLTAGAWGGRDFVQHITRYGVYGGFLLLFQ